MTFFASSAFLTASASAFFKILSYSSDALTFALVTISSASAFALSRESSYFFFKRSASRLETAWEAGPPSEQQTAALEKLGILPDAVESAGKAALLLDRLNKRRDEGLTTPKQIRCLEKYGFQHVGTWSFEAARHMIDRIAAQGWRGVPKGVNPRTYTPAAEPPAADSPFDFGW